MLDSMLSLFRMALGPVLFALAWLRMRILLRL